MEIKNLLESLGIEAETIEDFTTKFSEKYIAKTDASKDAVIRSEIESAVTGKISNIVQRKIEQGFGIEAKDKRWEDVVDMAKDKFVSLSKEFETFKSAEPDAKVNELTKKISEYEIQQNDFRKALEEKEALIASKESEFSSKLKDYSIKTSLSKVKEEVNSIFKTDISQVERKGFEAEISDNFNFDLENDELILTDKQGNKIKNPNKVGAFLTAKEGLENLASKLNLVKQNSNGGRVVQQQQQQQRQQEPTGSKIHPSVQKAIENAYKE